MTLVMPLVDGVATVQCVTCGMSLWTPIAQLHETTVGLYDDARFPGRCLVMLNQHHDDLDEVDPDLAARAFADVRAVRRAIKKVTGAPRMNYAVLGNAEPHVHWHLIPRQPEREPKPHKSPWNDTRPSRPLPSDERRNLLERLAQELERTSSALSLL